jgi:hypothetical protein
VLGETHALSATILIASMPGLLIAIARVANDSLAIALFAVLTYALVRPEPWDSRGALLIGSILGAGLLTKAYFVAALPAVLWSGAAAFLRLPVQKRTGCFARVAASLVLALALSGWWYVRTLGGGGPVWNDAAPLTPLVAGDLWRYALAMDWWEAAKVSLNAHLWVGGWSFLGVRSWMYDLLRGIFLIALTGGLSASAAQHSSVFGSLAPLWRILGSPALSRVREFHQCRNPREHRLVSVCRSGL